VKLETVVALSLIQKFTTAQSLAATLKYMSIAISVGLVSGMFGKVASTSINHT
jgi:hypothetical protein